LFKRLWQFVFVLPLLAGCDRQAAPGVAGLLFEITIANRLSEKPTEGRLLILIGRKKGLEPRFSVDPENPKSAAVLGRDVKGWAPGAALVVDSAADTFPFAQLSQLPKGDYVVQAVLAVNRDVKGIDAPGNLYSEPTEATLDPAKGGATSIELTHRSPPDETPPETAYVKFVRIHSDLLTKFRGRPVDLCAGVILPRGFDQDKDQRYPLRVHIGGYGTRYSDLRDDMEDSSKFRKAWLADDAPRMVMLQLDGAGPYGDPYQVNSDNNGPYGDAVTQELIPYVEKKYRCIAEPYARVLDGASTGGWVSLALQVFYPDFFNGAWAHAPDPVDFRSFELINIYEDANAYVNKYGFERPASRDVDGEVRTTVRHECRLERALGGGGRWELSGRDWGAWNAVFGPRGDDGLPKPLWDGATGAIDQDVLDHWRRYDLRLRMEQDWVRLRPKLRGKLHVWAGEADDYFLNNAVHLLDGFLSKARPPFEGKITYGMGGNHFWRGLTERGLLDEMAARIEAARK
jgi:S-formylglutathione hydrolase FrmB